MRVHNKVLFENFISRTCWCGKAFEGRSEVAFSRSPWLQKRHCSSRRSERWKSSWAPTAPAHCASFSSSDIAVWWVVRLPGELWKSVGLFRIAMVTSGGRKTKTHLPVWAFVSPQKELLPFDLWSLGEGQRSKGLTSPLQHHHHWHVIVASLTSLNFEPVTLYPAVKVWSTQQTWQ